MTFNRPVSIVQLLSLIAPVLCQNGGSWSPQITFPVVPVSGAIEPNTGRLLVWSSDSPTAYGQGSATTYSAEYDPATGAVTQMVVSNTNHDMFCPGTSAGFGGEFVVSGGESSDATSVWQDDGSDSFKSGPAMNIPRGYAAQVTVSDGRAFTIGGSWSGPQGNKTAEIYDGSANTWTLLPGCPAEPLYTSSDPQGVYREDNHAWLFAWSNGSVLQAGPSKQMNWYSTQGSGGVTGIGQRANDGDSMCGVAVMYDAAAGKILTAGGAPAYQSSLATSNAHVLTISGVNQPVDAQQIGNMQYAREFHNGVVLPDGSVFITGGQTWGNPFTDYNATNTPELWSPTNNAFTSMAVSPAPRTYHSIALLLPDVSTPLLHVPVLFDGPEPCSLTVFKGTVFSGGGGLCGNTCADPSFNHLDGHVWSPPYLFASDGTTPAPRPNITSVSSNTIALGSTFTAAIQADGVTSSNTAFSLIRLSTTTHTVNTDQRRLPLTPTAANGDTYTFQLPSDPGVVVPGYWFLFAMVEGVPSHATTVQVTP